MTRFSFSFLMLTILFTVIGQILVKQGMKQMGESPKELAMLPAYIWRTLWCPYIIFGLGSAVAAAMSWMVAVSRCSLSLAYPFIMLSVVLVLAISPLLFGESVSIRQWIGVGIVCIGLWLTAIGS